MALRSVASLSLSFGLVAIPVKVYTATESSAAIQFKLRARGGARIRQQYVTEPDVVFRPVAADPDDVARDTPAAAPTSASAKAVHGSADAAPTTSPVPPAAPSPAPSRSAPAPAPFASTRAAAPPWSRPESGPTVVERSDMVKGYEFEPGQFVLFEPEELKALAEASRQTIDIVAFIPEHSVDPVYYDKAYFLAPDKRGGKPYSLLLKAMRESGRCALAKWAWRSKQYMVQIRPAERGLVLQQLLYADEVRSLADLEIDRVEVSDAELDLALKLIEQISADGYDPTQYVDEEKERILAAVREKIAGRQIVVEHLPEPRSLPSAQVIDLVAALRASLDPGQAAAGSDAARRASPSATADKERKPVRRAARTADGKAAAGKAAAGKATAGKAADSRAVGRKASDRKAASGKS
jgi:DNA end-binding protein Ku